MSNITAEHLELIRNDYAAYCDFVYNYNSDEVVWKPTKLHTFLCDTVDDFVQRPARYEDGSKKAFEILILNTPPQVGKSVTITETYPAYYLGARDQHGNVIEISYNIGLARRFGRKNKQKIEAYNGILFDQHISKDNKSQQDFSIAGTTGGMISAGIEGGITGNPAKLMIIDDPVKNQEAADSPTQRQKVIDEWESSYRTRIAAGGKVIVIMTRWHKEDLAGYLMEEYSDLCEVVNIPCEAEENDPLGRNEGDPICPEIGKDAEWLADTKKSYLSGQGERVWFALFQGRPTNPQGQIIQREWIKRYEWTPDFYKKMRLIYISVDATFKDHDDTDYVAIGVWGKRGPNHYLLDLCRERMGFPMTIKVLRGLAVAYSRYKQILIEDKANGSAIIQVLRGEIRGILPIEPRGGKTARVNACAGVFETGNVWIPSNLPWGAVVVDELVEFPNAAHDDTVDQTSQYLNRASGGR